MKMHSAGFVFYVIREDAAVIIYVSLSLPYPIAGNRICEWTLTAEPS